MTGRQRLIQWLTKSHMNQRDLAKELGVHFTQVSKICCGIRRPGLRVAVQLEELTGIPAGAWLAAPVAEGKTRKKHSKKTAA